MRRACFHHKDSSQPSALSESRYSLFALRFSLEDESISLVILSVIWACGAPIEMKIDHGGTEITEKTLKKLKLRALRVSVVNDFRRSAGAPSLRAGVEGPPIPAKNLPMRDPSAKCPTAKCQLPSAKCQLPTANCMAPALLTISRLYRLLRRRGPKRISHPSLPTSIQNSG